ncbi:hypothetical protein DFQ30_006800 [Apophysomyces sp. BC1015]|nr:hypothetical protein DFQ30_006800 [Apophysomyces sp. BC1015]KAG0176697.1 hypothetical protein DFQ29_005809 [Apophysomyces sp. BC1021]
MSAQFPAMDQTTTTITSDMLYDFLVAVPNVSTDILSRETERQILTNCYRALWANDLDLMQKYFFKEGLSADGNISSVLEKYNLFHHDDSTSVHANQEHEQTDAEEDGPEYLESQRGKQCGHLFKNGESVYRCRNCGLDDTCVLCARCFHATNHDGHDVKIWVSRGFGGCCDCGDPEAWKIPLECRIHSLTAADDGAASTFATTAQYQRAESKSSVPAHLLTSIRKTIECVMDYILETFAVSPESSLETSETLPQNIQPDLYEDIARECENTHEALGLRMPSDSEKQQYACVLWNDEKHTFNQVITIVTRATGCSKSQASKVAQNVDAHGRHIIAVSDDLTKLLLIAGRINSIHLAVTIRSIQSIIREEVCGLLLTWLKDLVNGPCTFFGGVDGGNHIVRDIICEVLCADWTLRRQLGILSTRYRRRRVPQEEEAGYHSMDEDDAEMDEEGQAGLLEFLGTDINEIIFRESDAEEVIQDTDDSEEDENVDIDVDQERDEENDDEDDEDEDEDEDDEDNEDMEFEYSDDDVVMLPTPLHQTNAGRERPRAETYRRMQPSTTSNIKTVFTYHRASTVNQRDFIDMSWDLNAWLAHLEKLETEEHNISKTFGAALTSKEKATTETGKRLSKEFRRKLRLDYLLQYDLRLWKTARMTIKDLLIGTMVSNYDYRPIMGIRFARNYPELVDAFFFKDREAEHSICTLSVQLLTVPTVASLLVKEYEFFSVVSSILANFFLTNHIHMLLPDEYRTMQVDCASRAISRHRYAYAFCDLCYVLNADPVKVVIRQNPRYLRHFVDMLYQFQAMDPFERRADVHIEYESTRWADVFNVTLQTSKLCRHFAECYSPSKLSIDRTETSRDLCRAICRVLKVLEDWAPQPAPNLQNNEQAAAQLLIKGVNEQRFHRIETLYAGTFDIVEYDVSKEPVSFHHPFHWFLAELLENVSLLQDDLLVALGFPGGLKQMMYNAFNNTTQDTLLTILEYPLRIMVLLAQINCGVWVRNGFSVRNQARTYRDVGVRENTFDRDVYLLQIGLVSTKPDQLLLTMLDRFRIADWFNGSKDKAHEVYEQTQMTYIVEEFLNLLIICTNERGYAAGLSVEDKIRRSIIQYLGISSMAYSELVRLIPDSLTEHESFESLLGSLAVFKAPDGLNDHGVYELKDEYYDDIDPYYWHYTRNQREEAFGSLKKRWNSKNPERKLTEDEEFVAVPSPKKIEFGPFKSLGHFFQSRVLCQIIFYALWNTKATIHTESNIIIDEALHLAMLAVVEEDIIHQDNERAQVKGKFPADMDTEERRTFVENAVEDEYRIKVSEIERERASLLKLLLRCLDDNDLKQIHKRCIFIVDKIEVLGSQKAKELISHWRGTSEMAATETGNGASNAQMELERKKATAKARQAALMNQFAQAQSQFMAQHGDLYDDEEEEFSDETDAMPAIIANEEQNDEIERICHFPSGTCIVCQEQLDHSKVYGMLGLVQQSRIQRQTPLKDTDILVDILETSQGKIASQQLTENTSFQKKKHETRGFPTDAQVAGFHVSTCGHLMHADCFDNYQTTAEREILRIFHSHPELLKKRFLCPLCKALGNTLLPIVWKGKQESFPGVMMTQTSYDTLGQSIQDAITNLQQELEPDSSEEIPGSYAESVDEGRLCTENELDIGADSIEQLNYLNVQLINILQIVDGSDNVMGDHFRSMRLHYSMLQLYDMYAYTIASTEIAQRGKQTKDLTVEHTGTFLDGISTQIQTLLKLLSKINDLLPKVMITNWITDEKQVSRQLAMTSLRKLVYDGNDDPIGSEKRTPLLCNDPFKVLVHLGFAATDQGLEAHHLMRILLVAEFAKTTIALMQGLTGSDQFEDPKLVESLGRYHENQCVGEQEARNFATSLMELLQVPPSFVNEFFNQVGPSAFAALLRAFTLPYLRKCLLWMVTHHGIILQNDDNSRLATDEYDHLLQIMCLPKFDKLFDLTPSEVDIVTGWCTHYIKYSHVQVDTKLMAQTPEYTRLAPLSLNLPTQFSMAALPYRMDQLFNESVKRVCKKCHSVPEVPALCLICGTFVCAQRLCCAEEERGECNIHMRSCSGEFGLFMIINKCFILLLHDGGGAIMNAPYLDSHGEVDVFLKHGTPQYLNQKRYEQIRQMWLTHSVPAFVRRKMEVSSSLTPWDSW